MIVPELRLQSGQPEALDEQWCWFGKLAIVADHGQTENAAQVVKQLAGKVDIQVELHGVDIETALSLLNEGASEVIIPIERLEEFSVHIPSERLRAAVPWSDVEAITNTSQASKILVRLAEFNDQCLAALIERLVNCSLQLQSENTISSEQVAASHHAGIDCVIDENLFHSPEFLANSFSGMLKSDRYDGLWPTIIVDELGFALGLAYSNRESLLEVFSTRAGAYWSRSRNELWIKGKSSGATQAIVSIALDCDSDCLKFAVRQQPPGFCHRETYTCFGTERNIQAVISRLNERIKGTDQKSFTRKLANDRKMLETKLLEEAKELADAESSEEIAWEAADLIYFALIRMLDNGVSLEHVYSELARRMNRVVRRPNKLEKE